MVAVLIILFALLWVLTRNIRLEKKKERILRNNNLENATIIKYDGRMVKVYDIMTLVSLVGFFVSYGMPDFMEPVASLLFAVSLGMLIIGLPSWLMGKRYLNGLKKMGYQTPWYDRNYDYILENVPRTIENFETEKHFELEGYFEPEEHKEYKEYNKRSMVFAIIYGCIWLCMLAVNIWFCNRWPSMGIKEIFIVLAVVDIYWLIRALQFLKQMSNKKYKEATEIDPGRKNRIGMSRAVCEMTAVLVIACTVKSWFGDYLDYAYRSQVDHDRGWMITVHAALDVLYRELMEPKGVNGGFFTPEELNEDWSRSRQQLMEGVDITEWGEPQDVYQKKVAEHLVIRNFADLDKYFYSVKGDVKLYAKLENGVLTLSLSNQNDNGNGTIVIESETPLPEKEN